MDPPVPPFESERLAALLRLGVLDTEPEPAFDDVCRLAAQLCGVPIALVSLVDAQRQWFKARVGVSVTETARDAAFCAHALGSSEPLVVRDALEDPRFVDNPLVTGEPKIRFYAGAPLMLEPGITVGTLCIIDRVPRELTELERGALVALARQVTSELQLRRRLSRAEAAIGGRAAAVGDMLASRYRLEGILGVGGMGVVVAAHDTNASRPVAIKFLLPRLGEQPEAVERFVREARALARLKTEHVARILDVGNLANGAPYIVMDRLRGETCEGLLTRRGSLPFPEAVDIVRQVCDALSQAHAAGILHRDIKPANLFLAPRADGATQVMVLDFGISKLVRPEVATADTALTSASVVLGSPHYMAPEQMRGSPDVDARADVWSLGVVLYELLTGALPFEGACTAEIYVNVLSARPIPLEARGGVFPPGLAAVVDRCLAHDPAQRYPSAAAFSHALEPFAGPGLPDLRASDLPPAMPASFP